MVVRVECLISGMSPLKVTTMEAPVREGHGFVECPPCFGEHRGKKAELLRLAQVGKRAAKRVPLPPRILNPILVSYMDGHPLPDIPAHITAYTLPTDHSASSLQPSLCRILCLSGGQRTLHFHCMNP